jgi:hypothetical protein
MPGPGRAWRISQGIDSHDELRRRGLGPLGTTLISGGRTEARQPAAVWVGDATPLESHLGRLACDAPGRAGYLVGAIEVLTATALVLVARGAGCVIAAWTALLYLGFIVGVRVAIQRGTSCGCWGSFSDGVAGGAELGRAIGLTVVAISVAVIRPEGVELRWSGWSLVVGSALAGAVWAVSWGGRRMVPARSNIMPMRHPRWNGPVASQLALMSGVVANRLAGFDPPRPGSTVRGAQRDD